MITVTYAAQKHFTKLITNKKPGTQIRIFVTNPGSVNAKCGICFYFPEKFIPNDVIVELELLSIYIDKSYAFFLKDALIDVLVNNLDTQLTIKAPNITKKIDSTTNNKIKKDSLEERVKHILYDQINPRLQMHGGSVSLVRITEDSLAIIKFYGGCNGCMMANYTIKEGIENTLKNLIPELKGVLDVTQHQHGSHSFY